MLLLCEEAESAAITFSYMGSSFFECCGGGVLDADVEISPLSSFLACFCCCCCCCCSNCGGDRDFFEKLSDCESGAREEYAGGWKRASVGVGVAVGVGDPSRSGCCSCCCCV